MIQPSLSAGEAHIAAHSQNEGKTNRNLAAFIRLSRGAK